MGKKLTVRYPSKEWKQEWCFDKLKCESNRETELRLQSYTYIGSKGKWAKWTLLLIRYAQG